MAIDPQKMAAFASSGPAPGTDDLEAADAETQPEVETKGEDMLEGGEGRFGKLIPLLEANAQELDACCDEIDPEALMNVNADLPDDDRDILLESVVSLDDALLTEMVSSLGGVTPTEADQLAAHLEGESMIEDGDRLAAMLVHVGKMIDSGDIALGEDEGEEEDESEETPEEEYSDEGEEGEEEYEEEGEEY